MEAYLKAPTPWAAPPPPRGTPRPPLTAEQKAEQAAVAEAQEKWRLSQSMDGFKAFRKKYGSTRAGRIKAVMLKGFLEEIECVPASSASSRR